jgi:hypothetical protein
VFRAETPSNGNSVVEARRDDLGLPAGKPAGQQKIMLNESRKPD